MGPEGESLRALRSENKILLTRWLFLLHIIQVARSAAGPLNTSFIQP